MKGNILKNALVILSVFAGSYAEAQTTTSTESKQKDVTEVIINGQQNASDWFRAESQHFIVYSDTKREHVSKLLNKLERFDYLLRVYANVDKPVDAEPKLTLYYQSHIKDLDEIDKNQPAYAIGLYNSCALGVQAFGTHMYYSANTNIPLEKQPENEGLSYIFEAYARHFLYRHTDVRDPTWYIDGFAQYFANTRFSDTETVVGIPPQSVRDYLMFISGGNSYYSLDYKDILLGNESKGHNVAGEAGVRLEFQAKSWALTHYILSSSENIQHFRNYNNLVAQSMEHTKAFEQAFGYKISKLSNHLWTYKRKSAEGLKLNFTAGSAQDIQFSSLPISANKLLLADAALKSCSNSTAGASRLQKISEEAKKNPYSDYAQLILSRAQIDLGNAQDSLTYLTSKAKGDNFDAFYLLGLAQLRLAEQSQGDARKSYLVSAQNNFLKARTLNPLSAEAFYAYFKSGVRAQDTPTEDVLTAAIQARQLAPEVNSYVRAAALSYAYLKRIPETERALDLIARNSRDPQMAEWAKTWQAKLNSGVTRNILLAEMRLELVPNPRFTEWTVGSDSVMRAVQKGAEMAAIADFLKDQQIQNQQMQNQQTPNQGNYNGLK
jgi:hypothetical protein